MSLRTGLFCVKIGFIRRYINMLAYTYVENGRFELIEKEKPMLLDSRDAVVKITLASICSSDLHIKHGAVPKAVPGIT